MASKAHPANQKGTGNEQLDSIFQHLSSSIKETFDKPVAFDAIVKTVNPKNSSFVIMTEDKRREIQCRTQKSMENLKEGEGIRLMGSLHLKTNGTIFIRADDFYPMDKNGWYNKKARIYNKLRKYLLNEKRQKYISHMNEKMKMPEIISNIGLVVMPNQPTDLENFKISFQENCQGNLYIYHLKSSTMESDLRTAIEYFKKYHHIDLVCVVMAQLSTEDVFNLSSKDNLSYLLNRKDCSYIATVTPNHPASIPFPLIPMVINQNFDSIAEFTTCIRTIQNQTKKMINSTIDQACVQLEGKINFYEKKILRREMLLAGIFPHTDPLDRLKGLLTRGLDHKKDQLVKIETEMIRSIIQDERMETWVQHIIEAEKRNLSMKKSNDDVPEHYPRRTGTDSDMWPSHHFQ